MIRARDVADDPAARALDDVTLRDPQESDVELVQVEPLDPPTALESLLVGVDQPLLLVGARAGVGVVRRIAQHHEDRRLALHLGGQLALLLELGKDRGLALALAAPPGQRVGQ